MFEYRPSGETLHAANVEAASIIDTLFHLGDYLDALEACRADPPRPGLFLEVKVCGDPDVVAGLDGEDALTRLCLNSLEKLQDHEERLRHLLAGIVGKSFASANHAPILLLDDDTPYASAHEALARWAGSLVFACLIEVERPLRLGHTLATTDLQVLFDHWLVVEAALRRRFPSTEALNFASAAIQQEYARASLAPSTSPTLLGESPQPKRMGNTLSNEERLFRERFLDARKYQRLNWRELNVSDNGFSGFKQFLQMSDAADAFVKKDDPPKVAELLGSKLSQLKKMSPKMLKQMKGSFQRRPARDLRHGDV